MQVLKGGICKNCPPVKLILKTTARGCLTVAVVSYLAQLAVQLAVRTVNLEDRGDVSVYTSGKGALDRDGMELAG